MANLVCLIVIGIAGQFCYGPATLIGECVEMNYDQYLCEEEATAIRLRLSAYDPAWCQEIPTNCDGDTALGSGLPYEPYYDIAAACPADWYFHTITVDGVGSWECLDTGSALKPTFRNGEWLIIVEPLHEFPGDPRDGNNWPVWALQNYEGWSVAKP